MISKISAILFLGVLASIVASVHSHMYEEASAKYKRDPYKVLARFSQDELGLHSRRRRQVVDDQTLRVTEIEDIYRTLDAADDDVDDIDQTVEILKISILEYCYTSNYDLDTYLRTHFCPCPLKYRTIDGECNNHDNRLWGKADYPTLRLIDPIYADGISEPAKYDKTAREVSRNFVGSESKFDEYGASELVMHMGQFIDHDLALTPHLEADCECEETRDCLPIACNESDPMCGFQKCMKFVRSRPVREVKDTCGPNPLSLNGPRAHPNVVTSFLDASNVYGSYLKTSHQLRDTKGGKMSMVEGADPNNEEHIHLLPPDDDNKECQVGSSTKKCGKGGDIRAAEQPVLTSLHTLFVHEHNRIATELAEIQGKWTDEKLYQEARRIVTAIMQKIVYGEWLPIVLGSEVMEKYQLELWNGFAGYNKSINPTISNDFASAFFRFGHSMAPEDLKRVTPSYEDTHEDIPLRKSFFNASVTHDLGNGGINSLILGTLEKQCLAIDRHISSSICEHLFEGIDFALDLVALNIQRGRDHGLPPYIQYRKFCNLKTPDSFEEFKDFMDDEAVEGLKKSYSSVYEIEPFVGMLAENHLPGALVGPTLACILGNQFRNLKFGDRFWFENREGVQAFSEDQLAAIKKVTMARVICDNVNVDTIQPAVFKLKSEKEGNDVKFYEMINSEAYPNEKGQLNSFVNNRVKCEDYEKIPDLSLEAWEIEEPDLGYDYSFDDVYLNIFDP